MHVSNSELKLSNQHQSREQHSRVEAVLARVPRSQEPEGDRADISQLAAALQRTSRQQLSASAASMSPPDKTAGSDAKAETNADDSLPPKFRTLKYMIELLSGEKLDMSLVNRLKNINQSQNQTVSSSPAQTTSPNQGNGEPPATELVYVKEQRYWSQQNQFSASGQLTLDNGQHLSFEFESYFGQSVYSESSQLLTREELKDPLVLSFDGGPVTVGNERHQFDLDGDGEQDSVSVLDRNNAYLALDKNQDGSINNGLELFGARTNNGFAELAEYDDDGNGFIDSGDAIYDDLLLWFKQADSEQLTSLGKAQVAAISLDNLDTPFRLMDDEQQQQGVIRQSGVFIDNQGQGGLVQQIDLKV